MSNYYKERVTFSDLEIERIISKYYDVIFIGDYFWGKREFRKISTPEGAVVCDVSTAFRCRDSTGIKYFRDHNYEDNRILCFNESFPLSEENVKRFLYGEQPIWKKLFTKSDSFHYNVYNFLYRGKPLNDFFMKEYLEEFFIFGEDRYLYWHVKRNG